MATKKLSVRLESLRVEGQDVVVSITVRPPGGSPAPELMEVIARKRRSHESVKFSTVDVDALPGGQHSLITARHDCLVRGVWDMYVVVHQARGVEEVRFGRRRAPSVPPEGCSNLDLDPDTQDSVIAYFTRGAGNLSIDKGEVLHREVPRVRPSGLTLDENGSALMLVEMTREPRPDDEFFCTLEGIPQHGGRQLLPGNRLGERLISLRLPVSERTIGATVSMCAVLDGVQFDLPIAGTEYWPARATGFDLESRPNGKVRVVDSATGLRGRDALPAALIAPRRLRDSAGGRRRSIRATAMAVPGLGSLLTRGTRVMRRWGE